MGYTVGVDLGGTKTAAAVMGVDGILGPIVRLPTEPTRGPAWILGQVAVAVRRAIAESGRAPGDLSGIGVGSAGIFDSDGAVVAGNDTFPRWVGTPAARLIAEEFGTPTRVINDVDAHGLGEFAAGPGAGADPLVVVAVGTGVGAATIVNGRLLLGSRGAAGELGHLPSRLAHDRRCPCGVAGHLEAVAGGPPMLAAYVRAGGVADTFQELIVRAESGDDRASAIVQRGATALAEALVAVATVVDPEVIVMTGGVADAGPLWWQHLMTGFHDQLIPLQRDIPLRHSHQGVAAALRGAARAVHLPPA